MVEASCRNDEDHEILPDSAAPIVISSPASDVTSGTDDSDSSSSSNDYLRSDSDSRNDVNEISVWLQDNYG